MKNNDNLTYAKAFYTDLGKKKYISKVVKISENDIKDFILGKKDLEEFLFDPNDKYLYYFENDFVYRLNSYDFREGLKRRYYKKDVNRIDTFLSVLLRHEEFFGNMLCYEPNFDDLTSHDPDTIIYNIVCSIIKEMNIGTNLSIINEFIKILDDFNRFYYEGEEYSDTITLFLLYAGMAKDLNSQSPGLFPLEEKISKKFPIPYADSYFYYFCAGFIYSSVFYENDKLIPYAEGAMRNLKKAFSMHQDPWVAFYLAETYMYFRSLNLIDKANDALICKYYSYAYNVGNIAIAGCKLADCIEWSTGIKGNHYAAFNLLFHLENEFYIKEDEFEEMAENFYDEILYREANIREQYKITGNHKENLYRLIEAKILNDYRIENYFKQYSSKAARFIMMLLEKQKEKYNIRDREIDYKDGGYIIKNLNEVSINKKFDLFIGFKKMDNDLSLDLRFYLIRSIKFANFASYLASKDFIFLFKGIDNVDKIIELLDDKYTKSIEFIDNKIIIENEKGNLEIPFDHVVVKMLVDYDYAKKCKAIVVSKSSRNHFYSYYIYRKVDNIQTFEYHTFENGETYYINNIFECYEDELSPIFDKEIY